ncbi:MAG: transglycosylase SLT domain-containing protein [Thermoleophilaceae bacterium]|nr:transglycosylase SLT domain-containing protein [Thermoleophilaceae bacterium]
MRERVRDESGQAALLLLGVVAALLICVAILLGFGQALGAKSRHQRAADLAALSAAVAMRDAYPRLFDSGPDGLTVAAFEALARERALRVGRANGVTLRAWDVTFPGGSFAPTRVRVVARGAASVRVGERPRSVPVRASATAELAPGSDAILGGPARGEGGGYDGPLAYRMGHAMRPDVAAAFDRMAAAARRDGLTLSINSAFRSDAEQARLFAANPNPKWVAPPGTSLHRYATELDLGPPAAYGWLAASARPFGFIHRYAWEPWHYGFGPNPRDRAHPAQYERGSWEPPGGDHGRVVRRLPGFVPPRFHDGIAAAALRWNVPMELLAAQLYAESGFNPFAESAAGARGIAQFMPGTAREYGLADPLDPVASIDAQAHLMSDLLSRFGGKVALALAAYNAGAGAVERHGGIPPFAETRAYVARILGLLGGAGAIAGGSAWEVRLVG